ncbi:MULTISPECIES: winged helix-turn-helix domain-containing protein [Sphingomonas]|jgi:DNA-binding response OmpR family regulator|uniref:Winged helix family transcriptional regulator n=1 Tax=Sphingomonas ginsenosidimutans TaxID=862134 RepID=A0A2A4I0H6_9SPHN|nr:MULTISPECIES: winged helix-turn-helix domain-containing protein [Sphingomonas]MBY0300555.1 winged helix-turn-helix domain-containing protein [Sphingomonas ginsenosidimutans]PCG10612.1 winged helix family transcriptional regulator [Sphingomonas ginsenosidimutans]
MAVRLLIERPGLAAALRQVGLACVVEGAAPTVVIGAPADLSILAQRFAGAATLIVARDEAEEIATLAAGAGDCTRGGDAVIAARAARLHAQAPVWRIGDLVIDRIARTAARAGRPLDLRPREYALLAHLAARVGRTVPHDDLRRAVFGLRFDPGTNVLAVQVSRVRAALECDAAPPMLLTDRGRGYRLVAAPVPAL